MNKLILDLCIGNHDLFMKRRKPDSMEIQQMKTQAREEKLRRQVERSKYAREKQLREEAEREKAELEQRLLQYQEEARAAQDSLHRSEETAELLAEKVRVAEEEAMLLSQKSAEAEAEIQRIKISAIRTEEEKLLIERKAAEAELLATTMVEESERRVKEAEALRIELVKAKSSEKEAKEKLIELLRNPGQLPSPTINTNSYHTSPSPQPPNGTNIYIHGGGPSSPGGLMHNGGMGFNRSLDGLGSPLSPQIYHHQASNSLTHRDFHHLRIAEAEMTARHHEEAMFNNIRASMDGSPGSPYRGHQHPNGSLITVNTNAPPLNSPYHPASSGDLLTDADVEKLALEIEKERIEYLEKSRHLHNQLRDLKSEIQILKVEDRMTPLDRLYEENSNRGETKYSTLRKTKSGTTRDRVSFFEIL